MPKVCKETKLRLKEAIGNLIVAVFVCFIVCWLSNGILGLLSILWAILLSKHYFNKARIAYYDDPCKKMKQAFILAYRDLLIHNPKHSEIYHKRLHEIDNWLHKSVLKGGISYDQSIEIIKQCEFILNQIHKTD